VRALEVLIGELLAVDRLSTRTLNYAFKILARVITAGITQT
jgi:hypothetical protein